MAVIDPSSVLEAAKATGAVAVAAKKMLDLLRTSGNKDPELRAQMLDLYQAAFDDENERRGLRSRIDELEQQLRDKTSLVFRDNAYWDGNEGPICSPCFDTKRQRIRLHTVADGYYDCQSCKTRVIAELTRKAERAMADAALEAHNRQARGAKSWLDRD